MNQTIINGDCLTVLKEMSDENFDLIISDPPYKTRCSRAKLTERGTSTDRLRNRWVKKNIDEDNRVLAETGQFILVNIFLYPTISQTVGRSATLRQF